MNCRFIAVMVLLGGCGVDVGAAVGLIVGLRVGVDVGEAGMLGLGVARELVLLIFGEKSSPDANNRLAIRMPAIAAIAMLRVR